VNTQRNSLGKKWLIVRLPQFIDKRYIVYR